MWINHLWICFSNQFSNISLPSLIFFSIWNASSDPLSNSVNRFVYISFSGIVLEEYERRYDFRQLRKFVSHHRCLPVSPLSRPFHHQQILCDLQKFASSIVITSFHLNHLTLNRNHACIQISLCSFRSSIGQFYWPGQRTLSAQVCLRRDQGTYGLLELPVRRHTDHAKSVAQRAVPSK